MSTPDLDASQAICYHYGAFPPKELDYSRIATPLADAAASVARHEQMLKGIHNARLFLTPLERREALSSSRMEGTISTLDELLMYEANIAEDQSDKSAPRDTLEVHAYRTAMNQAQKMLDQGTGLSPELLSRVHKALLGSTRGHEKDPGNFKTDQNYLVDMARRKILFTPIAPPYLDQGLAKLFSFISHSEDHALITTAIAHAEFEALHPFNDGNGRIGRIFITLMMWKLGLLSGPFFYISGCLETRRTEYIARMRAVSETNDWTSWCIFFLEAVIAQAEMNLKTSEEITQLYEEMKETFRERLSSKWSINALDFVFTYPIFWNNSFTKRSGIPGQTAQRFSRILIETGLLTIVQRPSGQSPGLYAFEPLLQIVRQ